MENRKWGVRIMEAKKYRRIFTIVVDSCGIGGAKDAERFGDAGTDTLGHIAETVGNLSIPNMQKLGIANLKELEGIAPTEKPLAYYAKMNEASTGKDTMTGHWEMMGLHITTPFQTFTETGFPKETTMNQILRAGDVFKLKDLLPYQEGRIVNMDLIHEKNLKFVIMSFDEGTGLSEHAAPGEALVFALDGEAIIGYEGKEHHIRAGETFKFDKAGRHSVKAVGRFKMALLLVLE